jgi:hypothetical protein
VIYKNILRKNNIGNVPITPNFTPEDPESEMLVLEPETLL